VSGIAGLVDLDGAPVDRALLERMTTFQRFRGPDGFAVWADGSVGLSHTLLKTTDEAEHEMQPCSLDGRTWITADARVDDRSHLTDRLRGKGREVGPTVTDPELILHAYHAWDEGCLERLLGDFSFAIWDGPRRRLFCAVDHWGVKPFYYAHVGGSFVFSNTLDCVRMHPKVRDEFNEVAIGDFLLFGCYQDRDVTVYADIPRLAPGHCLVVDDQGVRPRRYWSLPVVDVVDRPHDETLDRFRELLGQAVGDRLRTKRLGIYMSGGLDSTLVAAVACQLLGERNGQFDLTAVTYVCDRLIPDDERHYAGVVGRALRIPIQFVPADDFGIFADSAMPAWLPPEPVGDPSWADQVSVAAATAEVAPVFLTGWDGDAALRADLRLHWIDRARRGQWYRLVSDIALYVFLHRTPPAMGLRTLLKRTRESLKPKPQLPPWIDPAFARRRDLCERLRVRSQCRRHRTARATAYAAYAFVEWTGVFDRQDPSWTGVPLEARHPLLDMRLVGFLLTLPTIPWCVNKEIFRRVAGVAIPAEIRRRPKAPLQGDPVTAQLSRMANWVGDSREFAPKSERFVVRSLIPRLAGCGSVDTVWSNLRPHGLEYWLRKRRGSRWDEGR
jgi:asparagine synthase (glutamine-hydrolysing)